MLPNVVCVTEWNLCYRVEHMLWSGVDVMELS